MERREYFDYVNIAKLILAVAIVAMHSALVPEQSWLMVLVCRLGVPYFFVASGFFLGKKCASGDPGRAVRGYIRRLLLPYAVFSVVWIAQMLIDDALAGLGVGESALKLIRHILFYPRGALWYVWASILGVLLLYPAIRRGKLLRVFPLWALMFMLGLLANTYYFIAAGLPRLKPVVDGYLRIFLVSNNAPFVACVFLLTGMLISERYDWLKESVKLPAAILILLLACGLQIGEASAIESRAAAVGDGAFYLSQLLYVPAAFYLTTRIDRPHVGPAFSLLAKNLSTGIYFLHVPILWIIHRAASYVLPRIPGAARLAPLFDHPSVCFAGCMLLCLAICLLSYRHPKSFLCRILK